MWNAACDAPYAASRPTGHACRARQPSPKHAAPVRRAMCATHPSTSYPSTENAPTGQADRHGRSAQLSQGLARSSRGGMSRRSRNASAPRYACHRPWSGCTNGPMGEGNTGPARCAHRMNGRYGEPPNGKCAAPSRIWARRETIRRLQRSSASGAPSFASSDAAKAAHIPDPALPTRTSVAAREPLPNRGTASSATT